MLSAKIRLYLKWLWVQGMALITLFPVVACQSSGVTLAKKVREDSVYAQALEKYTQNAKVYKDFQFLGELTVTWLSEDWRAAYARRWKEQRGAESAMWSELESNKTGFLISFFTPDRDFLDLTQGDLWTVRFLGQGGSPLSFDMRKISAKGVLQPHFPYVSQWSSETLALVQASQIDSLEIKSSLFSIVMKW